MRIGLDFGTTNSSAAVYDGQAVRLFRIDPSARDPAVVRSALYITRDHTIHIGQDAINIYYEQNTGRPSRMMRRSFSSGLRVTILLSTSASTRRAAAGRLILLRSASSLGWCMPPLIILRM